MVYKPVATVFPTAVATGRSKDRAFFIERKIQSLWYKFNSPHKMQTWGVSRVIKILKICIQLCFHQVINCFLWEIFALFVKIWNNAFFFQQKRKSRKLRKTPLIYKLWLMRYSGILLKWISLPLYLTIFLLNNKKNNNIKNNKLTNNI